MTEYFIKMPSVSRKMRKIFIVEIHLFTLSFGYEARISVISTLNLFRKPLRLRKNGSKKRNTAFRFKMYNFGSFYVGLFNAGPLGHEL